MVTNVINTKYKKQVQCAKKEAMQYPRWRCFHRNSAKNLEGKNCIQQTVKTMIGDVSIRQFDMHRSRMWRIGPTW